MGGRSGVLLAAFGICILLMAKQVRASVCTPSSGIYHLSSQQDLDELWSDCTVINGSIDMECDTSLPANERIRELEVFSLVQEVRGYLRIRKCDDLGSLEGLQRLERIAGFKLYNEPGARQGFAMYIENNAIIGDLAGLRSLKQIQGQGKRGAARVSIKTNDNLCYMDLVDWDAVVGSRGERAVSLLKTASCEDAACPVGCRACWGPDNDACQFREVQDASILPWLIPLVIVVTVAVAFLVWMCITRRCGCRMRYRRTAVQIGTVKNRRKSSMQQPLSPDTQLRHRGSTNSDPFHNVPFPNLQNTSA